MLWQCAYVGVGSNLDEPAVQVQRALEALGTLERTLLVAQSSLYRSKPWGLADQPDFVNAAAGLLTRLSVEEFFEALRALEMRLGRTPTQVRWGPRRIDLDLLVFDQLQQHSEQLQLPHPGIVTRNFVLYPLHEIAPDLLVPGSGPVSELIQRTDPSGIWRLDRQEPHGSHGR